MENAHDVAKYICKEYERITGETIGEMKLHKLLYFAQRESIAFLGRPLFECDFEAWKHGPVCKPVRDAYRLDGLSQYIGNIEGKSSFVVDDVIEQLGQHKAHEPHKELSRLNAHGDLAEDEPGRKVISIEDIIKDSDNVTISDSLWELFYSKFGDSLNEDNLNEETIEALEEADRISEDSHVKSCANVKEMFEEVLRGI